MRAPSESATSIGAVSLPRLAPVGATSRVAEHVVLIDEIGRASGTRPKHEVHGLDTPLHLGFSCYLFDGSGRVLLTQRAASKRTWPGVWTNSCCGHPQLGESLADAVRRRLRTELGMEPTAVRLVLADFAYRAVMDDGTVEHELCPVLVATSDDPVVANPAEVAAHAWVGWSDLVRRAAAGALSPWCREQVARIGADAPDVASRSRAADRALHRPYRVDSGFPRVVRPTAVEPLAPVRAAEDELTAYLGEQAVRAEQVSPVVRPLVDAVRSLVEAGGKRLRPAFVHWGHRAVGADHDDAVARAAAAMELLHTFALLQDDVMDRSATRRGRPSAHVELGAAARACPSIDDPEWFGVSAAILASDLAFGWADDLLNQARLPVSALAAARRVFADLRSEVIYGQYLDLASGSDLTAADAEPGYLRMALLKSARYTVTRPLLLGAALAPDRDPAAEGALRHYGDALGMAFQLRDDILGLFGDAGATGKSACDDLREGKRTLLVLRAARLSSAADRRFLFANVGNRDITPDAIGRCRDIVAGTGALASVERAIDHARASALDAVPSFARPAREALTAMASLAADRHL